MIQSIFVYGFLIISLVLLAKVASINFVRTRGQRSFWCWEIIGILFLYSFIASIRFDVGTDHLSYLNNYLLSQRGVSSIRTFEFIYDLILSFFSKLNIHFSLFFGFWAFIQMLLVLLAFKDKRHLYPYLLLCMILLQYFFLSSGIRQSVVCCGFIFALQYINNKNFVKYLIFITISLFIHKSAIFLLPFYFILCFNKDFFPYKWITIFLILAAIPISDWRIWEDILYLYDFSTLLGIVGYDNYNLTIEGVLTTGYEFTKGGRFYISALMPIIVALYSKNIKQFYGKDSINILNIYFIGRISAIVFYSGGVIFKRLLAYFHFFDFIGIAFLLYYLITSNKKMNVLVYLFVILLCILYFYFFVASDHHTYFRFYWDHFPLQLGH